MPVVYLYGRLEDGSTFRVRDDRRRPCFYIRSTDAERRGAHRRAHARADRPQDVRRLARRAHRGRGAVRRAAAARPAARRRHRHVRGRRAVCVALPHRARHQGRLRDHGRCDARRAQRVALRQPDAEAGARRDRAARAVVRHRDGPVGPQAARDLALCARARRGADRRPGEPRDAGARRALRRRESRARALLRARPHVRSRRVDGLEHDRLRLDGAATNRGARPASVRARPRRRRDEACARPKAISAAAKRTCRAGSCSTASTCCAARSCAWTTTRSTPSRARCSAKARPSPATCAIESREIQHNYAHDLPAFALYARTDARLAFEIVAKLNLVPLAFARSALTGMTPDRVAASIASFDFLYLSELERLKIVAPTVRSDDSRVHAAQQGGHVLEPVTGLHENVWVFDFKSLYPSIIRTFNIDPLAYVAAAAARRRSHRDAGRRVSPRARDPAAACSTSSSRAARRRSAPATPSRRRRSRS